MLIGMNNSRSENYNTRLHNAAKEGDLQTIKSILEKMHEETIEDCLNSSLKTGSTPLIIASRYGHTEVVAYLLSNCADPSVSGTVSFDGEIIPKVPPLWAAAAAGHLKICEILVAHNVDVNQTSSTNSTPLRGACYDGHLEIVKLLVENGADFEIPNRHGHTALMISCYRGKTELVEYLLARGALVNRRSLKGNTAMHDAAEVGNLSIIRMLVDAGAKMQKDDYGVTPLLTAALHGHMDIMPALFCHASRIEQRDAWKLLGATVVDRRNDLGFGILCWKTAYSSSRISDDEYLPLDPVKTRIYGGYREIQNLFDVLEIIGDPEAIRMQALIIRERILGEGHPETHYYLRYRGAVLCDMGRWERAYEFWIYILQLEQYYMKPLSITTTSSFVTFLDAFTAFVDSMVMQNDRYQSFDVTVEQVVVVMERAVYEAERYLRKNCENEPEEEFLEEEGRDIRQETENLLSIILQLLHLANRVYFLNSRRERHKKYRENSRQSVLPFNDVDLSFLNDLSTTRNNSSTLPFSDLSGTNASTSYTTQNAMEWSWNTPYSQSTSTEASTSSALNTSNVEFLSVNTPLSCNSSSPASSLLPSSSIIYCLTTQSPNVPPPSQNNNNFLQKVKEQLPEPYTFHLPTFFRPKLCKNAYLVSLTEESKNELDVHIPLRPKCQHLACLMRRIVSIFNLLEINPLQLACEEHEHYEIKRPPSRVVVEKLLAAGANVWGIDEYQNTALHTVLSNTIPSANIVKLLLDAGSPLLARNCFNETCLDLINKNAPELIKRLQIGKYLSLKQFAANVVMRNLNGKATFKDILPVCLENFLSTF